MQNLFTYPLKLEDMSSSVKKYKLTANEQELKFITEVMKVPSVNSFESEISVKLHSKEHIVDVWGWIKADVEHISVVSLEPFVRPYYTDFALKFDTKMTAQDIKEIDFDIEEDIPDILDNGQIDLAAISMEQLALILDDFPRQEGETFSFDSEFDEETTLRSNPFYVLKNLKK